jgi:hypothetical protein
MPFPGREYAPPNVYTQTDYENPLRGAIESLKIPVFIGEGNEYLSQLDLEVVRGSSATTDQRVVGEDMTGRAVVSVSATGVVTRGAFDGVLRKVQVRNLPIVDGSGRGLTSNSRGDVDVTINGLPVLVLAVSGAAGIVELAQAPNLGDEVKVSYFFNREDTQITDDVSDQVTAENAIIRAAVGIKDVNAPTPGTATIDLHADVIGPSGAVIVPANNVLNLIVDGTAATITITPKTDYTMQQIANVISAAAVGTLTGATFVNNFGESALSLNSNHDLTVLDGTANALLGLSAGQVSVRRKTFYTYNGPIVDGTNGGVTTTDPSHVTVKVAGVQVVPVSVDGASRAVTLASAPLAGAVVTIQYYFNTWQDTFDYLAHVNVTSISWVGDVPGGSQYTAASDYILQNDRIMWGTAATVVSGITTTGSELFDDTQITPTLVDNRTFMSPCTAVVSSQGAVSTSAFLLPFAPTLGNGRSTTLGASLFQSVANDRIGVPVNRPDVVDVYWGFSVEDALVRGSVEVISVEGSTVTLKDVVPTGASVYASFYHNMIVDMTYTLAVAIPGVSGVGTYTIQDSGANDVYTPTFDNSTKSAGLTGVIITFPSGSELTPDLHFEGGSGLLFTGPVEETVTVTFANTTDTPAKFTVAGPAPYSFIPAESDLVAMTINGDTVMPVAGIDLDTISGGGGGIMAHLVGDEIAYADGIDWDVADFTLGAEQIILTLDAVEITAPVPAVANTTVDTMVASINEAADGHQGAVGAGGPTVATFELEAAQRSATDDYYVGWRVVCGNTVTVPGNAGIVSTVTGYVASTGIATVTPAYGGVFTVADEYRIYNPDTMAVLKGAAKFTGPIDLSSGAGFDTLSVSITTNITAATTITASLPGAAYASATALATALNLAFRGVAGNDILTVPTVGSPLALVLVATPALDGADFIFTADGDGRLNVVLQLPGDDAAGFLEFLPQGAAVDDFAVLAGFDTSTANGEQMKLNVGEVAKSYRMTLGGVQPHDRLILRNRIHPGGVSMSADDAVGQCQLLVGAGSGNAKAGLTNADYGSAAGGGTVRAATVLGTVGFGGGTDTDGEPQVTFYDGTGTPAQNDTFDFTLDGVPVSVTLASAAAGTVNVLGLAAVAGDRIILQIQTAIGALPGAPFGNLAAVQGANIVRGEGAGIRITSPTYKETSQVVIGAGSANTALGFTEGTVAARTTVSAQVLASALNSDRAASVALFLTDFSSIGGAATEFAGQALATTVQDAAARTFLHIVSAGPATSDYGTGSTISLLDATTRSWLRVGTGIDELTLAGSAGEAALNGYIVTSNNASGSGSANTSVLGAGTGQDGHIGQTYRDTVTGLTFTILPRGWHDNNAGPWIAYPAAGTFRFVSAKTVTADANIPIRSLPGIELTVANTSGVGVGDTALVQTFPRGGEEPAIGDVYYTSYVYQKQDFTTAFFTKMSSIVAAYGAIHPENPVSLAAYLAMINGAVLVGIKQVPREENSNFASTASYVSAVTELEGVLPGHITPDIITPLKGDSTQLFQLLSRSNDIQSSIRYRQERTSIIGVAAGTSEESAKTLAQTLGSDRMRMVYPDMALIDIEENDGTTKEYLIDGPMLASMLAGSVVSPNFDVATPWTRRKLVGPSQLGRTLDAVAQNQLAVAGITVLDDKPPFIQVRQGFTTNMTNVLTKTPTVRLIADHVQQQSRSTLDQFIGMKFIQGILSQVEGRLARMLQGLVRQQIIAIYTGLKATVDPDDQTTANVEAFYQPVFPLLYIVLSFHLRSNLAG